MIDRRGVERPVQRAIHYVITFGIILAAHVLHHANVAAFHDHICRIVVALENGPEMRTRGMRCELRRTVRRARKENGRVIGSGGTLGDKNHRMQLHAIAHGDHDIPPRVIEGVSQRLEIRRGFAGVIRVLGWRRVLCPAR